MNKLTITITITTICAFTNTDVDAYNHKLFDTIPRETHSPPSLPRSATPQPSHPNDENKIKYRISTLRYCKQPFQVSWNVNVNVNIRPCTPKKGRRGKSKNKVRISTEEEPKKQYYTHLKISIHFFIIREVMQSSPEKKMLLLFPIISCSQLRSDNLIPG
jgi:hypothetical protein